MKPRLVPLGLAIIGLVVAAYLIWPEWFGFCETHDRGDGVMVCRSPLEAGVGDLLLPLTISFFVASLLVLISTKKTFSRWLKFSIGYGILVAVLLVVVPQIGGGMGGFSLTYITTQMFAIFYASLYGLISIVLLAASEILERRKKY